MNLEDRIRAFSKLGAYMGRLAEVEITETSILQKAREHNGWFTDDNLRHSLKHWALELNEASLLKWLSPYLMTLNNMKTVGVIMAGNVPLVGFHDFLSVLITGHKIKAKLSSNDAILLPHLAQKLIEFEPRFEGAIEFPKEKLEAFDAVIATGSNNTARYFEYYFGKYPHIIRKNKNGIAILKGDESAEDLLGLSHDIFRYFGLGCRNVSKIFLPQGYDFDPFFQAMYHWKDLINNDKYINNYDYNKAVYLMSEVALLDNEFMLLKEDSNFASPISVVFYEYYASLPELKVRLEGQQEHIQCVVGHAGIPDEIPFGSAQTPSLSQYADGVDTIDFLMGL